MPRPLPTFHGFIGRKEIVDPLRRQLEGAQTLNEPFPHTFIYGPSGVGKTQLAKSLAREFGATLHEVLSGLTPAGLIEKLKPVQRSDFAFIDEAHNLMPACQELLFQVIDNGRIKTAGRDDGSEHVVDVPPCTIVLATDQPGKLRSAMVRRMILPVRLTYYPPHEMRAIVDRIASQLQMLMSPQASGVIAGVAGGLPGKAEQFLDQLRLDLPSCRSEQATVEQVRRFLDSIGVDPKGLGRQEHDYLRYLKRAGAASVRSLALYLGVDADYVERQIEPFLVRLALIDVNSRGRQLTMAAEELLGDLRPEEHGGHDA